MEEDRSIAEQLLARLQEDGNDVSASASVLRDIYQEVVAVELSSEGQRLVYEDGSAILGGLAGTWVLEGKEAPWSAGEPPVIMSGWGYEAVKAAKEKGWLDKFVGLLDQITPGATEQFISWMDGCESASDFGKVH